MSRVYTGERQNAWIREIDEKARKENIVGIVIVIYSEDVVLKKRAIGVWVQQLLRGLLLRLALLPDGLTLDKSPSPTSSHASSSLTSSFCSISSLLFTFFDSYSLTSGASSLPTLSTILRGLPLFLGVRGC